MRAGFWPNNGPSPQLPMPQLQRRRDFQYTLASAKTGRLSRQILVDKFHGDHRADLHFGARLRALSGGYAAGAVDLHPADTDVQAGVEDGAVGLLAESPTTLGTVTVLESSDSSVYRMTVPPLGMGWLTAGICLRTVAHRPPLCSSGPVGSARWWPHGAGSPTGRG